jgi:hypothetical protein
MESMVLFGGSYRNEEITVKVRRLSCGAGEIDCIECGGTGIWTYLPPDGRAVPCTTCKATGKLLIGV